MAFYLDSALAEEAEIARQLGWVRGVTTNPVLLSNSSQSPENSLRKLAAAIPGEVFYQPTAPDLKGMLAEAQAAQRILGEQTVLKIPATPPGFQALARLSPEITCAVTAIFSPAQAAVAQVAGARYAIVYVNRSTRLIGDGPGLVRKVADLLTGTPTEILAASIKSPAEAIETPLAGAHHLTLPLAMLQAMGKHELTRKTMVEFSERGQGIDC